MKTTHIRSGAIEIALADYDAVRAKLDNALALAHDLGDFSALADAYDTAIADARIVRVAFNTAVSNSLNALANEAAEDDARAIKNEN